MRRTHGRRPTGIRRSIHGLSLLVLAALSFHVAAAVPDRMQCERLGLENGLSQLSITAGLQDPSGFLWFGTQAGLNRYDGYEFRVFTREFADPHTIGDSYIEDLLTGPDGRLWVATMSGGLSVYDPVLDRFTNYRHDPADTGSLSHNRLSSLAADPDGGLWIGSWGGGLNRLAPGSEDFVHFRHDPDDPTSLGDDAVRALMIDGEGRLWIGTNGGLFIREGERFRLQRLLAGDRQPAVAAMARTPDGSLWFGSEVDGLFQLAVDGRVRRFRSEPFDPTTIASDGVESLFVDRRGTLWVGTSEGLSAYLADQGRFRSFNHDPLDGGSLPANRVSHIMQDRSGLLWFGTWTGGLCKLNASVTSFRVYRALQDDPAGLPDSRVRGFHQQGDGDIWLATLGGGLVRFDPEDDSFQSFRHDPFYPNSIGSDALHSVTGDADGNLWLGSRDAGIDRFDPQTGTAIRFGGTGLLDSDHVLDLLVDDRQRLWIGTWDGGLSRLDIATGEVVTYRHDPDDPRSISSDSVGVVYQTRSGEIWLGTRGSGLMRYREEQDDFDSFRSDPDQQSGLLHGVITDILEDRSGQLWVATQGAGVTLLSFEGDLPRFQNYTHDDGLAGDAIGAIALDDAGRLWASTLLGVSRINPHDGNVVNFYPIHGVQKSGYYVGSGLHAGNGEIYFGGIDGFTRFEPVEFPVDTTPPQVVITNLLISNQPVAPAWRDPDSPLAHSVGHTDSVTLTHRQPIFSIEFAGLHYIEPAKNRYFYMLEGFDEDWVQTDASRRYATYTELDPGEYAFRVRAANRDGVMSTDEARMTIVVEPPPWRTVWAYLGYLLLAGAIVAVIGRQRWRARQAELDAQRAIQDSEEQLKQALFGSGDEFWILDLQDRSFKRMNPVHSEFETPVHTVEEFWAFVHEDDVPYVRQAMMDHVKGEAPYFEAMYRIVDPDDQQVLWLLSRGRVQVRDESGRAIVVSGATRDITPLKRTEEALRELNEKLESRVEERTADLREANDSLRDTLDKLRDTQNQLVESEKMASLGGLVAGVAHEINTPLGVAVTAASHLEKEIRQLLNRLDGEIPVDELVGACNQHLQNTQFVLKNLRRAAELVRSFKQVAVDQSTEDRRRFNLNDYLHEILVSLRPRFKRTRHVVNVTCPEALELDSFPGAIYQVITNLVMNSLVHGFEDIEEGRIDIGVVEEGGWIEIRYADDGRGFGPEVQRRIFEPFFTTRRSSGGSGLGMHIVYNLVTQVLGGTIECSSEPGEGVVVSVRLPSRASRESAA